VSELFVPTTPARYRDTFLPIATSPTTAESIAESRPQPGSRQSPKDRCIPHPLPLRCLVQLTAAGLSFITTLALFLVAYDGRPVLVPVPAAQSLPF